MYEMYPDDWSAAARPGRPVLGTSEADGTGDSEPRPRRRPRKAHSVIPPVIQRQLRRDQPIEPAA